MPAPAGLDAGTASQLIRGGSADLEGLGRMSWVKAIAVPLAFVISVGVALLGLDGADYWLDHRFMGSSAVPLWQTAAYAVVWLFLPILSGVLAAWSLREWWPWRLSLKLEPRCRKRVWWCLIFGYALTACVGAPMAQAELTRMVLEERRFEQAIDSSGVLPYRRVNAAREPWSRTALSVPVAPGVVVVYHEYQASMLNGRGAFYVFVWYGPRVRELTSFARWVS